MRIEEELHSFVFSWNPLADTELQKRVALREVSANATMIMLDTHAQLDVLYVRHDDVYRRQQRVPWNEDVDAPVSRPGMNGGAGRGLWGA